MLTEPLPLHLEVTSRCKLACPACPRTIYRGRYSVADLPLETIRRMGTSGLNYSLLFLCGDHGDPIYHPDFHELLRILLEFPGYPPIRIATNGSYRESEWWESVALLLRSQDRVVFGIDGLEDTAAIYRKNMNWASAINAMTILKKKSSCIVDWQWILFRHNQHQLSDARKLCLKIGIDNFRIVRSYRHSEGDMMEPSISLKGAYERFQS